MTKNISLLFVSYGINSYPEISIHNKDIPLLCFYDTTIDLIILDLRVHVTGGVASRSRIPNKFTKSCSQNKAIMISQNTGTKTKL
jgi:hypothetical protein